MAEYSPESSSMQSRPRTLDLPNDRLPAGCARSLYWVLKGVQNFGQGESLVLSVLCILQFETECINQPHKYKIMEAGQAVDTLKNNNF